MSTTGRSANTTSNNLEQGSKGGIDLAGDFKILELSEFRMKTLNFWPVDLSQKDVNPPVNLGNST